MRVLALVLSIALASCGDEPPPRVLPPPPPPPERIAVAAPRALASAGAFDLSATPEHVWLVYGPPSSLGGGLRALPLGPHGESEGDELTLSGGGSQTALQPQAEEIVARASDGRMRIAWVERNQLEFSVRSMLTSVNDPRSGGFETLGATTRSQAGRGSLALRADSGVFDLLYRRADGPCHDGAAARCARLASHRAPNPDSGRRGGGLSLPSPCAVPVIGFGSAGGVWYEAVCAEGASAQAGGESVRAAGERGSTTVFAFQFEPQYAHAENVLAGCTPYAFAELEEGVIVRADCGAVWVSNAGRDVLTLRDEPTWSCNEGRPSMRWGPRTLELGASRAGLEALLPSDFLGPSGRAVWTGQAVVGAERVGDELAVRRFECDDGTFRRTDHEAL